MIQGVIFDLFNTLVYETGEKTRFVQFSEQIGMNWRDYSYAKLFEKHFMTSIHPDFRTPIAGLLSELGIKASSELIEKLDSILNNFTPDSFRMFDDARSVLAALRGKLKLGMLTNCTAQVYSAIRKRFKFEDYFEGIVTSFQLGALKPERVAFQAALRSIGLNRDTALFVGDSFKDDVRAAENFGMIAVLVDRNLNHIQYENRVEQLQDIKRFLK